MKILNFLKDNKKKIIIIAPIIILIIIIIVLINSINKDNIFQKNVRNFNKIINEKFDYDTISGDIKLNINMKGLNTKNEIISDMKYDGNYKVDFKKNLINIDGKIKSNKKEIDNNIFIYDNSIYLFGKDVYDKYVKYELGTLDTFRNIKASTKVITILNDEIINTVSKENYKISKAKIGKEKVNKTILKFDKDYSKLKKEITKNLKDNKVFINNFSKYKGITKGQAKNEIDNINLKNYELILYTSKKNEFVRLDIINKDTKYIISRNDEKYSFKYYYRAGLTYEGYLVFDKDEITKINIKDIINGWDLEIEIKENNIKYNEKINIKNPIKDNNVILYNSLTDKDKNIINKNSIMKEINDNYNEREFYKVKRLPPLVESNEKEPEKLPHPKSYFK